MLDTGFSFDIRMTAGVPLPRVIDQIADVLVVGAPLFEVTQILRHGEINRETAGETLNTLFESGHQVVQLTGDDSESFFDLLMTKSPIHASRISGVVADTDLETVQRVVHRLFEVTGAHMALVEGASDQVRPRTRAAMDAVKKVVEGSAGSNWRRFTLSGLAYRTVLE